MISAIKAFQGENVFCYEGVSGENVSLYKGISGRKGFPSCKDVSGRKMISLIKVLHEENIFCCKGVSGRKHFSPMMASQEEKTLDGIIRFYHPNTVTVFDGVTGNWNVIQLVMRISLAVDFG